MLECRTLTTDEEVAALEPKWRELHKKVGVNPLADYGPYRVWWDVIARGKGSHPFVVTGWRDGRLVALLPFVVRNKAGLRILFISGYDVFLGSMALLEDPSDMDALWDVVRKSDLYDVAEIKYVRPESPTHKIVKTLPMAFVLDRGVTSMARFYGRTGKEWFETTLSKNRQANIRRKNKTLEEQHGALALDTYTDNVPDEIVQAAIAHKRAWCLNNGMNSFVIRDDALLKGIVKDTATRGVLRFLCLRSGQKYIGFCICFTSGKDLLAYLIAHDPAFSFFSPGFLTNLFSVQWAADNGFETFDFMEGPEGFKATLSNVRAPVETYIFCRSFKGFIGWLALIARNRKEALGRRLRSRGE